MGKMGQWRKAMLQRRGETIAKRSFLLATLRWKVYRTLCGGSISFKDYILERSAYKGRVSSMNGVRGFFSSFTIDEQRRAAEEPLKQLISRVEGCEELRFSTFCVSTGHPMAPLPLWRTGWRVAD